MQLQSAYTELKNMNNGFQYSIAQIDWWLLKYGDLYKEVSNTFNSLCDACSELQSEGLPTDCLTKPNYCNKTPEFQSFIKFYDELDKATQLNKLEDQCSKANDEFLLCLKEDLRDWVIKYYDLYEKLGAYFYGYLEFNSGDDKSLHIAETVDKSFGVSIREKDFINGIKFYGVYDDLYNNQKLYPEKIKEWNEFFSKIKFPKESYE